jgi:tetratricopeptide (TPR) repeat protein
METWPSTEARKISRRERERKIVDIVHNFLMTLLAFREIHRQFLQGSIRFSHLAEFVDDRGQSVLFALKESCHSLFRSRSAKVSEKEQIFDLTIGSIFHLAMKMREDLYQLEIYGPQYQQWNSEEESSGKQKNLIRQFKDILARAESSVRAGMEEILTLSRDGFRQFQELLPAYRDNGLLIRFFLERRDLLEKALGDHSLAAFWETLSGSDESRLYQLAGESYFESGFYRQAIEAFAHALEFCPADDQILFRKNLSEALEQFYSFAPSQALQSIEKCLSSPGLRGVPAPCRNLMRMICQRIQEDFPGRRKSDQHADWTEKARMLQRQIESLSENSSPSER